MLSLITKATYRPLTSLGTSVKATKGTLSQNVICKRWSGHNAMDIEPSNYFWKKYKDDVHFYTILALIPITVITTIVNIRANPELTEIPEGYEPRHWEYYKHPITRFLARYLYTPMEIEHEMFLDYCDKESQNIIIRKINRNANSVMSFYGDHRSLFFRPWHAADAIRRSRDEDEYNIGHVTTIPGDAMDLAYDSSQNQVPTEGYSSRDYPK